METTVAQALAQAFLQGWIPSDLDEDLVQALEYSAWGPEGLERLLGLAEEWRAGGLDTEGFVAQVTDLQEGFAEAAAQARAAADPGHEALRLLLQAMQWALQAMVEACAAVVASVRAGHPGALQEALASAGEAAEVMREIYDGTHF